MSSQEQIQSMANLGNFEIDPEGFRNYIDLRKGVDVDIYSEKGMYIEGTDQINQDRMRAEFYGIGGHLLERQWKFINSLPEEEIKGERIELDEHFWINFQDHYIEVTDKSMENLMDRAQDILSNPNQELDKEDKILMRYLFLQSKRSHGQGIGFPSFMDFITIYSRMAQAGIKKFKEVNGREITSDELKEILKDKSFMNMMTDLMVQNKPAFFPVAGTMLKDRVNSDDADLINKIGDRGLEFNPDCFEINEDKDGHFSLGWDEGFVAQSRRVADEHVKSLDSDSKHRILRCPVMYTGKFKEMCEWFFEQVKYHYIDQKYRKI